MHQKQNEQRKQQQQQYQKDLDEDKESRQRGQEYNDKAEKEEYQGETSDLNQEDLQIEKLDHMQLEDYHSANYESVDPNDASKLRFGMFKDAESKKSTKQGNYQESTAGPKYSERKLQESDSTCPQGDLYIRWLHRGDIGGGVSARREVRTLDMEIRAEDKMQFYTGIYFDYDNAQTECFIAKLNRQGAVQQMTYLNNDDRENELSHCVALSLTENQDVVVVGKVTNGDQGKTSALIMLLDDDLTATPIIKIWSNSLAYATTTLYQEATDVAVTVDGGIFVTGFISNDFSLGGYDCFVLRLNYTLDMIYAKSFGTAANHEECMSIQVTRNYDYLYMGAVRYATAAPTYKEFVFFKFDSYADNGVATRLTPTNNDQLQLRRILLTKKKQFSGGTNNDNDNNNLYFCGYTNRNNGDIIVGAITSTSLSVATPSITITNTFRYGSPQYESMGDCALTEGNDYLVVVFNTRHYIERRTGYAGNPIDYDYVYPGIIPADLPDPWDDDFAPDDCQFFTMSDRWCPQFPVTSMMASYHGNVRNYCETNLFTQLTTYVEEYDANIYSWTTCDYYYYDYSQTDCSINDIRFSECSASSASAISTVTHWGIYSCFPFPCFYNRSSTRDCRDILTQINTQKPWYNAFGDCRNDNFRDRVWQLVFGSRTNQAQRDKWWPYIFCYDSNATATTRNAQNCGYDVFHFVFEQDCSDDANAGTFDNWMIIKIEIASFTDANLASFPQEAAYFGDRDGHTTAYTIAVDELGFIYISGTSNSVRNGAIGTVGALANERIWIYAKTHWKLHYEARFEQTNTKYTGVLEYLAKRFVQPKKFKNNQSPSYYNPATVAITFTVNFRTAEATQTAMTFKTHYFGYYINEETDFLTEFTFSGNPATQLHGYLTNFVAGQGYSSNTLATTQTSMNEFSSVQVTKTTDTHYVNLPNLCIAGVAGSGNSTTNVWRGYYTNKAYQGGSSVAGLSITTTNQEFSGQGYISGVATGNEGIYRTWYLGNGYTYYFNPSGTNVDYDCPAAYYAWYQDNVDFPALQRVIVDDTSLFPPENKKNIPDITPTVGHRYEITDIDDYFTTSCTYYKAKQKKQIASGNPSYTTLNTTMLPYWMMFYEQNHTFVMYPVDVAVYQIEVYCCNAIDQCAINTFSVSPKDATPVSTFGTGITPYTIQYDSYEDQGQHFDWSLSSLYFSDADAATDALDTAYSHTDHTVWLTFTTLVTDFDHIAWMGMLFGHATARNLGTQTFTYQYQDQYSLMTIPTATFSILINTRPSPTQDGIDYVFENIDPTDDNATTYFDDRLPFVKDDLAQILEVDTSEWFEEDDAGDTLTYELTYSDGTTRPNWIGYDINTGILRGYPDVTDASELMNLRFTAYDENDGTFSFHKTLLVNVEPRAIRIYKTLYMGVDRDYAHYLGGYIQDLDGDKLTWSLTKSSDQDDLREIGLDFYAEKKIIAGRPIRTGVWSPIYVEASDPHGATAKIYLTINVRNYKVDRRDNAAMYKDQTVIAGQPFHFVQSNEVFYDMENSQTLILFASTESDGPLPDWLHFNPVSRVFYGTAPSPQSFKVQLRAINQYSHDSLSGEFKLTVIQNSFPRVNLPDISDDIVVEADQWFEHTISRLLFRDYEVNRNDSIEMIGAYGMDLPKWLKYNQDNRTVYGITNQTGSYRIDFVYTDDCGDKTYQNMRVTIVPKPSDAVTENTNIAILYFLTMSAFVGLFVYLAYLLHYNFQLYDEYRTMRNRMSSIKHAQKRFKKYQDIEVFYHLPKYEQISFIDGNQGNVPNTVRTFDHRMERLGDTTSNISMLRGNDITTDFIDIQDQSMHDDKKTKVVY